jgi:hypothetical protein
MDGEAITMPYPSLPLHHHHPNSYHLPKYHEQLDQSQTFPQPVFSQKGLK